MHILPRLGPTERHELRCKWEDGVAHYFCFAAELVPVEGGVGQFGGYGCADGGGDYSAGGLGAGEGCFGVDAAGYVGFVVEDLWGGVSH